MGTRSDQRRSAPLVCAGIALVLGWFAFVRETRVPLLGWCDLGIHEFGHFLFMAVQAPQLVVAMMGNGFQTLVPLMVAATLLTRGDWPGAGVCVAWAGATLQDASVYIADAPLQDLPLFTPGATHDWRLALGPEDGLDLLESAAGIATFVHHTGFVAVVAGLCMCVVPTVRRWSAAEPAVTPPSRAAARTVR